MKQDAWWYLESWDCLKEGFINSGESGIVFTVIMWYSHIQWYISFSLLDCMVLEAVIYDQKKSCISLRLKFNCPKSQHYELFIIIFEKYVGIGNKNFSGTVPNSLDIG